MSRKSGKLPEVRVITKNKSSHISVSNKGYLAKNSYRITQELSLKLTRRRRRRRRRRKEEEEEEQQQQQQLQQPEAPLDLGVSLQVKPDLWNISPSLLLSITEKEEEKRSHGTKKHKPYGTPKKVAHYKAQDI